MHSSLIMCAPSEWDSTRCLLGTFASEREWACCLSIQQHPPSVSPALQLTILWTIMGYIVIWHPFQHTIKSNEKNQEWCVCM